MATRLIPSQDEGRHTAETKVLKRPGDKGVVGDETPRPAQRHERTPTVGGFEIVRRLGHGGMGIVYLARETALNRLVALKVVAGGVFAEAEVLERFQREAEAIASLRHPNIVQIYRVGASDGGDATAPPSPYIALEYVECGTLAAHVGKPMATRSAARLVATLARAIHSAHERGIVHRDLKPGNILLARSEAPPAGPDPIDHLEPKVTDFGLAKLASATESRTVDGSMLGTPEYMSPEQTAGRADLGPASDVYSLGVILYELLTGRTPFRGADALDTLQLIRTTEPVPPARLQPRLPRDLNTICLRSLEKAPERRYASAAAFAADLEAWMENRPIEARPVGPVERAVKWARRRPAIATLLAAVVFLAGIGFTGVSWQWRRAEARANAERQALDHAENLLYFGRIGLAQRELAAGNREEAEQLLAACVPTDGKKDRRSWEWSYLKNQCRLELFSFRATRDWVWDLAFSPDGATIATACGSPYEGQTTPGQLLTWDSLTGTPRGRFEGHTGAVRRVAFSRDGKRLGTSSYDKTVRVWDASTGRAIATTAAGAFFHDPVTAVFGDVHPLHFTPDNRSVECATGAGRIRFDPDSGSTENAPELTGEAARSPDGRFVLILTTPHEYFVLDRWTGKKRGPHSSFRGIHRAAVSPDGACAYLTFYHQIEARDTATNDVLSVFDGCTAHVETLSVAPCGQTIAAGAGNRVYVFALYWSRPMIYIGHDAEVRTVAFSPDGRRLASGDRGGRVFLWDLTRRPHEECVTGQTHSSMQLAVAPCGDGRTVAAIHLDDGVLLRFDIATGSRTRIHLDGITNTIRFPRVDARFSDDGLSVYAPRRDDPNVVSRWDALTGTTLLSYSGHTRAVGGLALSRDGSRLATRSVVDLGDPVGGGCEILIWDAADGRLLGRVPDEPICGIALSPTGDLLAGANLNGETVVWDTATRRELWRERTGPSPETTERLATFGLAFSPDGRMIASAGFDQGVVSVRSATTGQAVCPPIPTRPSQTGVTFTSDSRRVVVAGYDGDVRFWDAATGQPVLTLVQPSATRTGDIAFTALPVFSARNQRLVIMNHFGSYCTWDGRAER